MSAQTCQRISAQKGMVLITSLLLLIVVTLLAIGLFRSFGLDERIAGNVREKHRALNAAETAEQYAEWWLAQGNAGTGVPCSSLLPYTAPAVCSNPIVGDPAKLALPWSIGVSYAPLVPTAMDVTGAAGGPNTYYFSPSFYITYLGAAPGPVGSGTVYQIDAVGYAGSPDTAAVVESTYLIQTTAPCLTCNPEG